MSTKQSINYGTAVVAAIFRQAAQAKKAARQAAAADCRPNRGHFLQSGRAVLPEPEEKICEPV
jgi:hypothetical protein